MDLLNRRGNQQQLQEIFKSFFILSSLVLPPALSLTTPSSAFSIFNCMQSHGTAGRACLSWQEDGIFLEHLPSAS